MLLNHLISQWLSHRLNKTLKNPALLRHGRKLITENLKLLIVRILILLLKHPHGLLRVLLRDMLPILNRLIAENLQKTNVNLLYFLRFPLKTDIKLLYFLIFSKISLFKILTKLLHFLRFCYSMALRSSEHQYATDLSNSYLARLRLASHCSMSLLTPLTILGPRNSIQIQFKI